MYKPLSVDNRSDLRSRLVPDGNSLHCLRVQSLIEPVFTLSEIYSYVCTSKNLPILANITMQASQDYSSRETRGRTHRAAVAGSNSTMNLAQASAKDATLRNEIKNEIPQTPRFLFRRSCNSEHHASGGDTHLNAKDKVVPHAFLSEIGSLPDWREEDFAAVLGNQAPNNVGMKMCIEG